MFEEHVTNFIKHLKTQKDVIKALVAAEIPSISPRLVGVGFNTLLAEMVRDIKALKAEELGVNEFVDVFTPLWRCHSYQVIVVIEALGRCTCIPTVMLVDALKCVLSSLLHKGMEVEWDTYALTQRYWAVVTTDPGSAKSPALKEIMESLHSVFSDGKTESWFYGIREHDYHVVHDSTHAAFNARLQQSEGCAFPATPEGGNLLCEGFKERAVFQGDKINLIKCLESANGGSYHWDVQENVKNRKKKQADEDKTSNDGVHFERTNINLLIFQQKSILQNWWAQTEARWKQGLANRFLFSSGRRVTQAPGYDLSLVLPSKFFLDLSGRQGCRRRGF